MNIGRRIKLSARYSGRFLFSLAPLLIILVLCALSF